jgi:hypothetical protein
MARIKHRAHKMTNTKMVDWLRGEKPPKKMLVASRRKLNAMFEDEYRKSVERREAMQQVHKELHAPFLESLQNNKNHQALLKKVAKLNKARTQEKLEAPHSAPVEERVFIHSVGLTRTPPYDWPWTWSATNGNPSAPVVAADRNAGDISFLVGSGDGGGSASAATAVGMYFRPAISNVGFLQITANVALNWTWWTYNVFDSSHSDGWLGIYVGSYDSNGTQYTHIDQRVTIWNEDHSFLAGPDGRGSNSGWPLSSAQFINSDSFYEVWVWCGGSASGFGQGFLNGSWAGSAIRAHVPFIHLEYWG